MCKVMEDMIYDKCQEALYNQSMYTAKCLLEYGEDSLEKIAKASKLSIDEVKAIKEKLEQTKK